MESLFEQRKGNEMTFLEKAKEILKAEGEKIEDNDIMSGYCPCDFGLEDVECTKVGRVCEKCWNREMPNTELENVKEAFSEIGKAISKASEDVYKEDMNTAYNKGLNDGRNEVWEFLDRIEHAIKSSVLIEVFGYSNIGDILDHLKPQEALTKLKAYEEAQIEVGDVVEGQMSGKKAIVTRTDGSHLDVITNEGGIGCWDKEVCKKTGKHIDIKSILESIGE